MNYKTVINAMLKTESNTIELQYKLRMRDKSWQTHYHGTDIRLAISGCPLLQELVRNHLTNNNVNVKNIDVAYRYLATSFWAQWK